MNRREFLHPAGVASAGAPPGCPVGRTAYARNPSRRNRAAGFIRKAKAAEEAGLAALEEVLRTIRA